MEALTSLRGQQEDLIMAKDNMNFEIKLNAEAGKVINTVCGNIEKANELLKENKDLLTKVFQCSLEIIETQDSI